MGWRCGGAARRGDWVKPGVQVGELGGHTRLSAFSLSLSFSRMWSLQLTVVMDARSRRVVGWVTTHLWTQLVL